jgi:DOPA 4,5-dioxygenase
MTPAADPDAPFHAHIYYRDHQRAAAETLRDEFSRLARSGGEPRVLFVGEMRDAPVGPHPMPQYEIHFLRAAIPAVVPMIEASGLRALVHPLTDDDLADHTTLAQWIGPALDLDLTNLDPPGKNQGVPRFGARDV